MTTLTPDELAQIESRFEAFDLETSQVFEAGDPKTPADVLLTEALAARALFQRKADEAMRSAVGAARDQGLSWHRIGLRLGVTGEAVRQRYAKA